MSSLHSRKTLKSKLITVFCFFFWLFCFVLLRALHGLEDLGPLFKIFYRFVCKKVPGKITDKYLENLSKPLENFKHRYGPKFF